MTVALDDATRAFLDTQHSAAMTTLRADGTPHTVRVGVALVEGKIWSSGTRSRLRTKHLRRDPRSTLFVFDAAWRWLALECRVNILDGADAPDLHVRLFEVMQQGMQREPGTLVWNGAPLTVDEFRRAMVDEERLIYEFMPQRTYGLYAEMPSR